MRKFLTASILSLTLMGAASIAEAKSAGASNSASPATFAAEPQVRIQIGRGRQRRPARVVTSTRTTRVGRSVYRETIQTRYLPNGRTVTKVISRVRVR